MSEEQINKLYCRYEARLGASMTKTLGDSFIEFYTFGISKYFNIIDPKKLTKDLKEDLFFYHALTRACCSLYYKFGMLFAPFTALLIAYRQTDFDKKENNFSINKDG